MVNERVVALETFTFGSCRVLGYVVWSGALMLRKRLWNIFYSIVPLTVQGVWVSGDGLLR